MGMKRGFRNFILTLRDFFFPYIPFLKFHRYDFAFLVHPRDTEDVYKKYRIAKYFPQKVIEACLWLFWPVTVAEIKGLVSQRISKSLRGILISIPLTSRQILENKQKGLKFVVRGCKLAEKLGARVIGLGAYTSSISEGGRVLKGNIKAFLTNGNSLTVGNSISLINDIIEERKLRKEDFTIALVGATGSIGSAISRLLLMYNFPNLIFIGNTSAHIQELKEKLSDFSAVQDGKVLFTNDLNGMRKADMVIMAVAKEGIISDITLFKKGAIIYDISQPKGIDRKLLKSRPDVVLFDGGLAKTPHINFPVNIGFPPEVNFSCLAETMLLAAEGVNEDFIGKVDISKVEEILEIAKKYQFIPYHIQK